MAVNAIQGGQAPLAPTKQTRTPIVGVKQTIVSMEPATKLKDVSANSDSSILVVEKRNRIAGSVRTELSHWTMLVTIKVNAMSLRAVSAKKVSLEKRAKLKWSILASKSSVKTAEPVTNSMAASVQTGFRVICVKKSIIAMMWNAIQGLATVANASVMMASLVLIAVKKWLGV